MFCLMEKCWPLPEPLSLHQLTSLKYMTNTNLNHVQRSTRANTVSFSPMSVSMYYNNNTCHHSSNEGEFNLATSFLLLNMMNLEFNQNSFASGSAMFHLLSKEACKENKEKFHWLPLKEISTASLMSMCWNKDTIKLLHQKHIIMLHKSHQLCQSGSVRYSVPSHCLYIIFSLFLATLD